MSKIVHFEIPVDDPDRALAFYEEVFDWKATSWEGPQAYWLVTAGEKEEPGIDGALALRKDYAELYGDDKPAVTNVIGVPSVDAALERVKAAGGTVVYPKNAVPGVGYAAYFRDPEGNVLGVFESDESAD